MAQKERLLNYLTDHKSINPIVSWNYLGIYRLSDVIYKLRKDGYDIKTNEVEVKNQFGEICRVANYELAK